METRSDLERKAKEHDVAKERIIATIQGNIEVAISKLRLAEKDLLSEVEIEFGNNIYRNLLNSVDSGNSHKEEEIRKILAKRVPEDFGPDEESFRSLLEEIDSFKSWKRKTRKESRLNCFDLIPKNLKCTSITCDSITLSWNKIDCDCFYEIETKSLTSVKGIYHSFDTEYTITGLNPTTEYHIRVRTVMSQNSKQFIWSDPITAKTGRSFFECEWKECPTFINRNIKYSLDRRNHKIATKINGDDYCTIVGDMTIPLNKVTAWNVRVLKSRSNDGSGINIGVAPYDIKQSEYDNFEKCGWYFYCYSSTLFSGPYHNFYDKTYGPRKAWIGDYVHAGDIVGVETNTIRRELSFVVNGVNLGPAFEGIPLDKPLVPCVLLLLEGDSVELLF